MFIFIFSRAEDYHDQYIFEHGFMARIPDEAGGIVWTNLDFYNSMLNDHPLVKKRKALVEKKRQTIVPFVNLAKENTSNLGLSAFHRFFFKQKLLNS